MAAPLSVRSSPKDLTRDGIGEVCYVSEDWEQVTLIHTADTAGDLLVGFTGGKLSEASAFLLPRNVVVQITLPPDVTLTAMTTQGRRRLNVIGTPLPWSEKLFCRLAEALVSLERLVARFSR